MHPKISDKPNSHFFPISRAFAFLVRKRKEKECIHVRGDKNTEKKRRIVRDALTSALFLI